MKILRQRNFLLHGAIPEAQWLKNEPKKTSDYPRVCKVKIKAGKSDLETKWGEIRVEG